MIDFLVSVLYWIVPIIIGFISSLIIYTRWNYGTLENTKGLTGVVAPYFVGGSAPFFYNTIVSEEDTKNAKKYGSCYGFYEGREPQIYISDPDVIRHIFIKDFDSFHNKRTFDAGHHLINEMMDILPYKKWKAVRTFMSPQLTTGKIRHMSYQMLEAINEWSLNLKKKFGDKDSLEFTPKDTYTALTTDVIAKCAFGTKIDALDNPDNIFVKHIKKLSMEDTHVSFMFTIVLMYPFLMKFIPFFPPDTMDYFGGVLKDILKSRRKSNQEKINDFVDVMNDMIDKCSTDPEFKELGITENTVMCQAMFFLLAGFETTASTLTNMSYRLAKNPKIQEKLIEEVEAYLERHDGKIGHETITELTYLTACMNETLRMDPPLIRLERVCQKDWVYEPTGLHIKKDMVIQVPVFAVHFNEKYFPEPNEFKPERFLPENASELNPYAFLSFGQGPHNCIGMRFAKEEVLMTMASVLKDFRIESCQDAKLKVLPGRLFLNNFEPFHLKICKRK